MYNEGLDVMDKIIINDLYVETVIGFYHWEHEEPQPLILNLSLGVSFDQVFSDASLESTINYAQISKSIKLLCMNSKFHLMESLAKAILEHIFKHYPVKNVRLSIKKPQALRSGVPSIECYRTYEQMQKISNL